MRPKSARIETRIFLDPFRLGLLEAYFNVPIGLRKWDGVHDMKG